MSQTKTFEQWLEEFKKEIKKGYEKATMVMALSEHVYKDKVFTALPKYDTPLRASIVHEGEQLVPVRASLRTVNPLDAGFIQDLGDWSDNPEGYGMDMFMNDLGKLVADREYAIIAFSMKNCAGNTFKSEKGGHLSKDDIRKAQSLAEGYADSVIMNHQEKVEFLKNGQILDPNRIPESFVPKERRGYYYSGMIGAVNVYWASFIEDFALVFNREEIISASAPLKIRFDDIRHPKQLIGEKLCVSAPMLDQAVVKIELV
jgi:hypothetical protein